MAESFSFDVVSDFDRQELVNTLDQVKREISQRYDLKGTDTSVDLEKENIFIITNSELTLNAVNDIIRQKAIKRNLSLKIFDYGDIEIVSGSTVTRVLEGQVEVTPSLRHFSSANGIGDESPAL